ncbi:hypothetical protein ATG98_4017 [Marinobacter sp. LV10R520-4]|uniref:hypothetical protein n=1 Tax=Marinobacter sp. LV10R520-4 TaxID=1761796 RepID=UPI000BF898D7|nr:hypothetical protein [Marinobacter sp. LV10R520-4]PFG54722.1 hypothetical protein ATG98_4017 [Marinobacter sp. LV10R520-4]
MAADETIRVVVKVNPSRHPELHEALKNNDGRAERIRSLALMALSGIAVAGDVRPDPDGSSGQRTKRKPAGNQIKGESPTSESASAVNDDNAKSVAALPSKPEPEPEEDPQKDLIASVVSGLKKSSF